MLYIACPEKFATGGTELLHQLFYKLKSIGIESKIYYYNYTTGDPVAERFKKYEVEYVLEIEDKKNNLLIVPEVATYLLEKFNKIEKSIWWLSIDNYFVSKKNENNKIKKFFKKLFKIQRIKSEISKNQEINHYVQSVYAKKFLEKRKIKRIQYLSDYLNEAFLKEKVDYSSRNRENIVLYNPRKGIEFTTKIIKKYKELKFIALENMTPEQIVEICKKSKVYIDFGNHPGKDRFPREAAILGCCIITGKKGAAKYFEDIPILDKYKFKDSVNEIELIGSIILKIFENYDEKIREFEYYREVIKNEEKKFSEDIVKIFL